MNLKRSGGIFLLILSLSVPVTPSDEWSWGTDNGEAKTESLESTTKSSASVPDGGDEGDVEGQDRQARFLGLSQKLCSLGIGSKCNKKAYPAAIDSHYGPPPAASSHVATSSYATLEYDTPAGDGHGYPAASSKGSAGGFKPLFVPPKPYPGHAAIKPSVLVPNTKYTAPVVTPAYVAPKPAHTKIVHDHISPTSIVQHVHSHTHIHQGLSGVASSGSVGHNPSISTGTIHVVGSGVSDVNSHGGHVSGSGFQPILPVSSGKEIPPVTGGNIPLVPLETLSSGTEYKLSSSSTSGAAIPPVTGGAGITTTFGGHVSSSGSHQVFSSGSGIGKPSSTGGIIPPASFGGQVSNNGFQQTSSSSFGKNIPSVTGGNIPNSFGSKASGIGFQHTQSSSSGINVPQATGGIIETNSFGGQVSGSGFHQVSSSSSGGIIPSVPGGVTTTSSFGDKVSGKGFQHTQSSSSGVNVPHATGGISTTNVFGGQVSGSGFHQVSSSSSGGIIPSVPGGVTTTSSFGDKVSGKGFQHTQSSSSGVNVPHATGGISTTNVFGGQVSGSGFHQVSSSSSGGIVPPVTGGVITTSSFGDKVNGNGLQQVSSSSYGGVIPSVTGGVTLTDSFGGQVSGKGFQHVSSTVNDGVIPPTSHGGQVNGNGFQIIPPSKTGGVLPTVTTGFGTSISSGSGFQTTVHHANGVQSHGAPIPGLIQEQQFPAYREECQCVARQLCPVSDVVPRHFSVDIRNLIDARSRRTDILSNATEVEEEVTTTTATDVEDEVSTIMTTFIDDEVSTTITPFADDEVPTTIAPEDEAAPSDIEEESRQKRDLLSGVHHEHDHDHDHEIDHDEHESDIQERQFGGYTPGPTGCPAPHVCCRNPVYAPPKKHLTCGKSNAAGLLGRVRNPYSVNGDAEFAEYAWQAAILKLEQGETEYVCGAVLISDRHLLTAAHCINSLQPNALKVRLGEWDVSSKSEFYQYVEIPVSNVIVNKDYYAGNLQNDIALMTLQRPVDFDKNPHISPVCLPEDHASFVGQRCHSSGWGKDAHGEGGKFQRVLKEVEVSVVAHHQCQKALRHTRLGATFHLHEGNICAGGEEGRDTCEGDGGGPLVCQGSDGRFQLAGLVSWGIGCGKVGIPGVYVNVAHYLGWIRTFLH